MMLFDLRAIYKYTLIFPLGVAIAFMGLLIETYINPPPVFPFFVCGLLVMFLATIAYIILAIHKNIAYLLGLLIESEEQRVFGTEEKR